MSFGIIEYDQNGLPKCEVCNQYFHRVLSHVRQKHAMTAREEFVRTALKNDGYVSQKNIIDDQITALRNCIVDLAKLKTLLTEGITKQ